jgi:hypothetical protein
MKHEAWPIKRHPSVSLNDQKRGGEKNKSQAEGIIPRRNPELLLQCKEEKRARVGMGQESEFFV